MPRKNVDLGIMWHFLLYLLNNVWNQVYFCTGEATFWVFTLTAHCLRNVYLSLVGFHTFMIALFLCVSLSFYRVIKFSIYLSWFWSILLLFDLQFWLHEFQYFCFFLWVIDCFLCFLMLRSKKVRHQISVSLRFNNASTNVVCVIICVTISGHAEKLNCAMWMKLLSKFQALLSFGHSY